MSLLTKIMIVEDSLTQALRLQQLLKNNGVTDIAVAKSGQEALDLLEEEHHWSAIISDINMPEMNGFELCRIVKGNALLRDIPFILLVSLKDPKDVLSALQAGADNMILKEYNQDYFITQLKSAVHCATVREDKQSVEVFSFGEWRQFEASPAQLAAMAMSAFAIAVHEKAARVNQVISSGVREHS